MHISTGWFLNKPRLVSLLSKPVVHLLAILGVGAGLYLFTLPYPFVFDDIGFLQKNPFISSGAGFSDLLDLDNFASAYLPRVDDRDLVTSFALRPFAYLTFRLNYLCGGMNPSGFRATNIAIHLANATVVYLLLRLLIQSRQNHPDRFVFIPVFASLLFLVHPLQTESVTYVTQRFTSLGTCFYLASLLTYALYETALDRWQRVSFYLASLVTMVIGMQTSEIMFTAPFTIALMALIVMRRRAWGTLKKIVPHLCCLAIVPAVVLTLSNDMTSGGSTGSALKIVNYNGLSQVDYALTQIRVILSYFRLLVLPYNQNFDPDYPLFKNLMQPEMLLSIAIWGVFVAAVTILLRQRSRNVEQDLVLFSLINFPLLLSVSSSVVPLPDLMSEHRTYLASVAFAIGLAAHLDLLRRRLSVPRQRAIAFAFSMLIVLFGMLTIQRNCVYRSPFTLWSDTAAKSPSKARPALALGNACLESGNSDCAIEWLTKAIQLNRDYLEPYLSLGTLFQSLAMPHNAVDLYISYLADHPPESRLLSNLALAYQESGNAEQALSVLKKAIEIDPADEMIRLVMAEHLYMLDRDHEARLYLEQARELDQQNPLTDYSAVIKFLEGQYESAAELTPRGHIGEVKS